MPTYVAFLRAINLGARRKLPMAELRACLTEAGLADVETHINTGNVRFRSAMRSRPRLEEYVEQVLAADRGFDVPTIVLTPAELRAVRDGMPVGEPELGEGARRYVTLLKQDATAEAAAALDGWDADGERVRVAGRAVYWWLDRPTHQARMSNARLEKLLGVATTRDFNVITTLADRWGA